MNTNHQNSPNVSSHGQGKDTKKIPEPTIIEPEFDLQNPAAFINHIESLKGGEAKKSDNGLFISKTANKWLNQAMQKPVSKMLFSEFWHENEVCVLFSDSNLGKSILAVQIADSITKGTPIPGFKLEAIKQPVIYFDFELSDKQFEIRYSELDSHSKTCKNHFDFDEGFSRIEINPNFNLPEKITFDDFLIDSIEEMVLSSHSKILIIDNLTFLKNETEKAKDAIPLIKRLKALKNKHGLSLLILAHTPKKPSTNPITKNDLSGSKAIMNLIDSSFAIGESQKAHDILYLKQIKERDTEKKYHAKNVVICKRCKPGNFLHFEFQGYETEWEHLSVDENPIDNLSDQKQQVYGELPSTFHTNEAWLVAEKHGMSRSTFDRFLKRKGVFKKIEHGTYMKLLNT